MSEATINVPSWVLSRHPGTKAEEWKPLGQGWVHGTARVGDYASVGYYASVGDGAIVGNDASVGDGARVGNGAIVGDYASVGNGARFERSELP